MQDEIVLVYTTWPNAETAEQFAAEAVAERLCACANVGAAIRSIYHWEGAVERAVETPVLFKTTAARAEALRDLILARHPYDTPAVVASRVTIDGSNPAFLDWICAETARSTAAT